MATVERMTADQYYSVTVEGDRKQLVDGRIVVDEPKPIHGVLQLRLGAALYDWIQTGSGRGLALLPTDVRLDAYNVYGPDLLWFRQDRIPADLYAYPEHLPDLCVEIRSTSTWRYDIGTKKRVYEAGGLPELWLVDHVSSTVLVYRRSKPESPTFDVALELGRGEVLVSPMLPGFTLPLEELFARPRR